MPTAVVSGSGPVGALVAILLAKRGYTVKIYEKRALPERRPPPADTRAFLINLNERAMRAFKLAGVDLRQLTGPHNGKLVQAFMNNKGRIFHSFTMSVDEKQPKMLRVFRDELSRHLIEEAQRLHPDKVTFVFNASLDAVDFDKHVATIRRREGTIQDHHEGVAQESYDLLVGADGANSKVRSELQKQLPADFVRRLKHPTVYCTGPLEDAEEESGYPDSTFLLVHGILQGVVMIYGRGDGDKRVGLFLNQPDADRLRAGDKQWMLDMAANELPGLPESARVAVSNLVKTAPVFQKVSDWTYLSQMHGPKTVLMGDAAHTMTPVLGQGCNSGLEDATIFVQVLDKEGGDLAAALPLFNAERLPDIHALIQLNEIAAQERASLKGSAPAVWHRLWVLSHAGLMTMHMSLHKALHTMAPRFFSLPTLMQAQLGIKRFRTVLPAMYTDLAVVSGIGAVLCGVSYAAVVNRKS